MDLRFHYLLATICTLFSMTLLAIYVHVNGPRKRVDRLYVQWTVCIALWSFFLLLSILAKTQGTATALCRLLHIWAALIPITFLRFVLELTRKFHQRRLALKMFSGTATALVLTIWTPWFLAAEMKPAFGFFVTEPKALYFVHPAFFVLCVAYALFELWESSRRASGIQRKQLQYFFIGLLIGYAGGTENYMINFDLKLFPLYPFGSYTILPAVAMVGLSIVRYKLMDFETLLKRSLVFAGLSAFILGAVAFTTLILQELLSQYIQIERWVPTLAAAILVVLVYDPLKTFLVNTTDKYLFQKPYDYRELLRQFTDEVITVLDLRKLVDMTVNTLQQTMKIESVGLWLLNRITNRYELTAAKGIAGQGLYLPEDDPLVKFLQKTQEPVVKEQIRQKENSGFEVMEGTLAKLKSEVCLPLALREEMVGILTLGRKKSDEPYTEEDLSTLTALAKTEAVAISNALLAAEAAQKEKLAVIGTLAAAINHEVCNPLNNVKVQAEGLLLQLKRGMLKDLPREELEKRVMALAQTTMQEVDRAAAITTRLSNFSKPAREPVTEPVAVNKVVDEVFSLLGHDLELREIALEKVILPEVPMVLADQRQLQEIVFNLVRNAGQAIGQKGKVTVSVGMNGSGRVAIQIADTGCGIPPENLQRLFTPFFTTKGEGKGTGLGLFVIKRLVERNEGTIAVKSEVGVGTTFTAEFPAAGATIQAKAS